MALIKCNECNAQVSDKAKNCPKCGAPVIVTETVKCFECGADLEKGTKVCSNCGVDQDLEQNVKEESKKIQATESAIYQSNPKKKSKLLIWYVIGFGTLILILIGVTVKNQNSTHSTKPSDNVISGNSFFSQPPREKSPTELRQELEDKERQTPLTYLSAESRWDNKVPLFGKVENYLIVTVSNSATMAQFQDIILNIQFLAITDALLGTTPYTWNEYFPPKGSKSVKIKIHPPAGTKKYAVTIISCK
jgi:ribosomal protein L40E